MLIFILYYTVSSIFVSAAELVKLRRKCSVEEFFEVTSTQVSIPWSSPSPGPHHPWSLIVPCDGLQVVSIPVGHLSRTRNFWCTTPRVNNVGSLNRVLETLSVSAPPGIQVLRGLNRILPVSVEVSEGAVDPSTPRVQPPLVVMGRHVPIDWIWWIGGCINSWGHTIIFRDNLWRIGGIPVDLERPGGTQCTQNVFRTGPHN